MARITRADLFCDNQFFHILVQGNARIDVFRTDMLKLFYLQQMSDKLKKFPSVKIMAFCMMDNHAHILLHSDFTNDISLFFKEVNLIFAQYYNKINNRVGYVFRGRFKSEPIGDETYLVNCINYIHNNPVKAGIVSSPLLYPFSSCEGYQTLRGISDYDFIKQVFGDIPQLGEEPCLFIDDEESCSSIRQTIFKNISDKYDIDLNDAIQMNALPNDKLKIIIAELRQRIPKISINELVVALNITRSKIYYVIYEAK